MRVVANLAMTVDGKIAPASGERLRLGSAEDLRRMKLLRSEVDAVVAGGNTFRHWPIPWKSDLPLINAILTRRGILNSLPESSERWRRAQVDLQVFTWSDSVDVEPLREWGAQVFVSDNPTVLWLCETLHRQGCSTILLEGGGELLFSFLSYGLVQELFLTVTPSILGGRASKSLVEGAGFSVLNRPELSLDGVEQHEDELYLRYTIKRYTQP